MNWKTFVCQWEGARLVELIGAPRRTVYSWRDGSSSPPEWSQPALREYILRRARERDAAAAAAPTAGPSWSRDPAPEVERHPAPEVERRPESVV